MCLSINILVYYRYKTMENNSTTTTLIPHRRSCHVAARVGCNLIITGGIAYRGGMTFSPREIWMYHLMRKTWGVYHVPEDEEAPKYIEGACTVNIGLYNIYVHGGYGGDGRQIPTPTNAIWRLSRKAGYSNAFQWKELTFEKQSQTLAPRYDHSGWSYANKLWTFGGSVPVATGYLDDHEDNIEDRYTGVGFYSSRQVHSYDPVCHEWSKVECSGDIPCHRSNQATTIVHDKAWLFGGQDGIEGISLNDLHMLDMKTLTWTLVYSGKDEVVSGLLEGHTLTAMSDSQLLLYGGMTEEMDPMDTKPWKTWIFDIIGRSWRQINEYEENGRSHCTATIGLDNNVIIVGGQEIGEIAPLFDPEEHINDEDLMQEEGDFEEEPLFDPEEHINDEDLIQEEGDFEEEPLFVPEEHINDEDLMQEEGDFEEEPLFDPEEHEEEQGPNDADDIIIHADANFYNKYDAKENVLSMSTSPPSLVTLAVTALYKNNVLVLEDEIPETVYNFYFR